MQHLKVFITPINTNGVVLWVDELIPNTEYIVRYKGSGGGFISKKFNSNQLTVFPKINLESN